MFSLKPEQKKIEPIVFLDQFLCEKIQRKSTYGSQEASHVSLSKYFPKYYKHLSLSSENLAGAIQSKVKRLKIVRSCYDSAYLKDGDEKTFKKFFRTNRKTLKDVPMSGDYDVVQSFPLCTYFPRVKAINLENQYWGLRKAYQRNPMSLGKSIQKRIYRSFGDFWSGCRFVESLKVGVYYDLDIVIIKKIDSSKRFLSFLKKLELEILVRPQNSRKILIELIENKNFLRHVTHLKVGDFEEKRLDWKLFQSLISSCPRLYFLSFPTGSRDRRSGPYQSFLNKDFCLDLGCLENLQVLEMDVKHFKTFINGVQFPPFLREMTLRISDHEESDSLKEFFDRQDDQDEAADYMLLDEDQDEESSEKCQDDMVGYMLLDEDQNERNWESSEKSRMLGEFFEKWKKLENLRVLNLTLDSLSDMDTLVKNFLLPLLRAIPNLETFNYEFLSQQSRWSFDLEAFFSGIEPLRSLRHLRIHTDVRHNCVFSGLCPPQKLSSLSKLSSIEIDVKIHSRFDLKQFLDGFLGAHNPELKIKKSLKLPRLYLFRVQDFIRFLDLMHSVSDFKDFQAHLQIALVVERMSEIPSNFQNPIVVTSNIMLVVNIFIKDFESTILTQEQEQYFQMVFGQLQFTVKKADPSECEVRLFDSGCRSHREVMKNKLTQNCYIKSGF